MDGKENGGANHGERSAKPRLCKSAKGAKET